MFIRVLIIILVSFLTSCGLPEDLKSQAAKIGNQIQGVEKYILQEEREYKSFTDDQSLKPIQKYSKLENWPGNLKKARDDFDKAKQIYDSEVVPMIEKDSRGQREELNRALSRIDAFLSRSRKKSEYILKRINLLRRNYQEADKMNEKTQADYSLIQKVLQELQSPKRAATKKFPQKRQGIEKRYQTLVKLEQDAQKSLQRFGQEYQHHKNQEDTNYLLIGNETNKIKHISEKANVEKLIYTNALNSLSTSYSKVLKDAKIRFFVVVGRSSWCSYCEYDNTSNITYPPTEINAKLFEKLQKISPNSLIGTDINNAPQGIPLDPQRSASQSDNSAEFWIEDLYMKTYYKYIDIRENKQTETKWVEVDNEDYFENIENIGMEIVSKPYGDFDDEANKTASPAGMNYVGNPHYGRWSNQGSQRSWQWLPTFVFLSSYNSRPYGYNDWNHWNRNYRRERPFYGRDEAHPVYGSAGSSIGNSKKYSNSNYMKNRKFYRKHRPASSIRHGGSSSRNRGPGFGK